MSSKVESCGAMLVPASGGVTGKGLRKGELGDCTVCVLNGATLPLSTVIHSSHLGPQPL